MAKILPGFGVAKISGTIGGTTYSNYRGMIVARTKPVPSKTLTVRQMEINALMSLLSQAWRDELNQGLRNAWNQMAKNFPWVDVFGNERKMTGENLYIKQNMVLLDHSLSRQDTPAPTVHPPEITDFSVEVNPSYIEVVFDLIDDAIVTAQTPFIDIWIAGGFTDIVPDLPESPEIHSLALPAGRLYQKSDMRHAVYQNDPGALPGDPIKARVVTPSGSDKNVTLVLRRYNKYGNFSSAVSVQNIVPGA